MEITRPAIIAFFAYLVLAFMIMLPLPSNEYPGRKYHFGYRLLVLFIMLIPIGLSLYSINCMMVGKCVIWSYVQSIAIVLWVMLFVLATLLSSRDETIYFTKIEDI